MRTEGGGHLAALPTLVPPVAGGTEGQRSHGQRRQKAWSSKAAVVNSSRLEKLIVLVVAAVAAEAANAAQHELVAAQHLSIGQLQILLLLLLLSSGGARLKEGIVQIGDHDQEKERKKNERFFSFSSFASFFL